MSAGGFSRIYAGLGEQQISVKSQTYIVQWCLGPAAVGSAPNAALFFCTYDTIKKQAIAKWENLFIVK